MPRITCRVPSSQRPYPIRLQSVPTAWTVIAEAPDFSVPDTQNTFPDRDPADSQRAIRPGEIFILTPIKARNKSSTTRWIEARIQTGSAFPQTFLLERIEVPPGESVTLITQGLSLLKRNAATAVGDTLSVRAEATNSFDISGAGQERPSAEHLGVQA
jgi:hypothetical protein